MPAWLVSFGILDIDGRRFEYDVVIECGRVARRGGSDGAIEWPACARVDGEPAGIRN